MFWAYGIVAIILALGIVAITITLAVLCFMNPEKANAFLLLINSPLLVLLITNRKAVQEATDKLTASIKKP